MSFVQTVERGIVSSTYNPEAEKAMREDKKLASEARQKYREALFKLRDKKTEMVSKKEASDFFIKQVDALVKEGFDWVTKNPDADVQTITDQAQNTIEKYEIIQKANIAVLGINFLPDYLRTVASNALLQKKIDEKKKAALDSLADSIAGWLKKSPNSTAEQIFTKQEELQLELKEQLKELGDIPPAITTESAAQKAEKDLKKKKEAVKKEEEANKNTFQFKRLLKQTYEIAMSVVGSLFILMLFLVSGMLTANDAIGRDPQYRILYFVYGGLGFPILLIYYLYRWFFGTAPHIYRLLPLYTQPADTTLGRFFFFPFTYVEDQAARDAKTKFMTQAANLVGKEYKPPAEAMADKLGSVLEGIQGLALNTGEAVKRSVENIVT